MSDNPLTGGSLDETFGELPATGAWRDGDDPGPRLFADIGTLDLECGTALPVTVAYETWGTPSETAILLCHPLTGDSHAAGTGGWWSNIVGPGLAIDTNLHYVIAPNVLGGCQGTTGPASLGPDGRVWAGRFPEITVRDQVEAEKRLMEHLGIKRWRTVAGASAGGHRVIEWGATYPELCESLAILVSGAVTTGEQIAYCHQQITAIELDPAFNGGDYYDAAPGEGPHRGLGLARAIAHTTYRCPGEFNTRFGNSHQAGEDPGTGGRYAAGSYLDYHGNKLATRFDANSYITLTKAMMSHDAGRGRGGARVALDRLTMDVLVVAVDSDRLFFASDVEDLARSLPGKVTFATVHSDFGHDGFLVENDQVSEIIGAFVSGRS